MFWASWRLAIGMAEIPGLARNDQPAHDHAVDLLRVLTRLASGASHGSPRYDRDETIPI